MGADVHEPNPFEQHPTASPPIAPWCSCSRGHCYQDTAHGPAWKKSNTSACEYICTTQGYP